MDAGISCKRIEEGTKQMELKTSDMDGILVTHEHSDHIAGLGVIARRYGLPIYATTKTIDAIMSSKSVGKIDPSLFCPIYPDEKFSIGNLTVKPLHVSHDAADPVAYVVSDGKKKIGVITDLGCYDDYMIENINELNVILLEANHDVNMLQVGSYPYPLKQRILGDKGHLSNECSGQLLGKVLHDKMQHIFLGHLSQENNYASLAYETVRLEVSTGDNPYQGNDFPMTVARRNEVSRKVVV